MIGAAPASLFATAHLLLSLLILPPSPHHIQAEGSPPRKERGARQIKLLLRLPHRKAWPTAPGQKRWAQTPRALTQKRKKSRTHKVVMMASSSGSPCAACKFLRRKCTTECVFAPYFPPDQPHKFANVHKIFGASNITKLLNELPPHQREDAVNSLAYEADARVKDPVYGCVGAISVLQRQIAQLQQELAMAHSDLARIGSGAGGALMAGPSGLHAGPSSALAAGMGLSLPPTMQPSTRDQILASRDHYFSAREQQTRLAREAQFLELQRDSQMTREQLIEQLTRAGGGSLEAGLAVFGMGGFMQHGGISGPGANYPRSTSDGGSGSSGGGASMNRLSPP
ncbi:hypothetical protein GOP47_0017761 [Adiantum capillus-veneris]|uniref:LOB domain-containing protein n=1 Tax=Adiantum capillus-veneris TaxID=13818 RepID=A0A9D4UGV1_ADICA|nr:hypothetical protein GOP47_0017761 [Adiantum capillus-veneris]